MPEYRRAKNRGGTFFFTVVTYHRKPLFIHDNVRSLLHQAWINTEKHFPFITEAICLLPDHLHCIWRLPEDDTNYSVRWKEIKRLFTKAYLLTIGPGEERNDSRVEKGEAAIWQRRFWEHMIVDEEDYRRHMDYIHYNPVKHGLVDQVVDWEWSSFHRYVKMGVYDRGWGGNHEEDTDRMVGE